MKRRLIVLAVLVYVTLDLSLPTMPGAFVFELADSAESTQVRARDAAESIMLPALARDSGCVLFKPPLEADERIAPGGPSGHRGRPAGRRQFRAPYDSPPPSEDPH